MTSKSKSGYQKSIIFFSRTGYWLFQSSPNYHFLIAMKSYQRCGLLPKSIISSQTIRPCACGPTQEGYPDISGVCRQFQAGTCGYKTSHDTEEEERVHCCAICLKVRKKVFNSNHNYLHVAQEHHHLPQHPRCQVWRPPLSIEETVECILSPHTIG